ncbi:MAG TPA: serine hydrolase domain-containing protein [Candidatus Elarobacter sp.]|jgi:CubicO group peptidase (beta-lactamase class C family)|nr:serine hydrolase domain-containing protein [Candidatus Elarobacter sp.]
MKTMMVLALAAAWSLAAGTPARGQTATPPASGTTTAGALTPAQTAAIDAIGRTSIDLRMAPSVDLAVLRDGAFVYHKGFGVRNVEDAVSPDDQTRYPIGSNTKQFTATSILMLQDQGKLNVDATLATYLPQIPHSRQVTLRNLLMHTGGYSEFTAREDFDEVGARPATPAQVVAAAVAKPLDFKPGTKRSYSNTGYLLLQMVIEKVSGQRYADFVSSHVFKPLGMTSSYVRVGDDTSPDVATEYDNYSLGPWEHALHIDYTWFGGAGSIISNATDLAKWNAALDGGKLLSKRSQHEMMTPVKVDQNFPDYGFAIQITKLPNGHTMIYHGGNTTGAATQDARFPDDHLQIIVLANSGFYDYTEAVNAIYTILVPSEQAKKPAPKSAKPAPRPSPNPAAKPADIAAAKAWLDDAVRGKVDLTKLRADFRARFSLQHQAALRAIAAFGPRTYTLADVDRRAPATSYLFLVKTPKAQLLYAYARDDDGSVAEAEVIRHVTFPPPAKGTPPPVASTPAP